MFIINRQQLIQKVLPSRSYKLTFEIYNNLWMTYWPFNLRSNMAPMSTLRWVLSSVYMCWQMPSVYAFDRRHLISVDAHRWNYEFSFTIQSHAYDGYLIQDKHKQKTHLLNRNTDYIMALIFFLQIYYELTNWAFFDMYKKTIKQKTLVTPKLYEWNLPNEVRCIYLDANISVLKHKIDMQIICI